MDPVAVAQLGCMAVAFVAITGLSLEVAGHGVSRANAALHGAYAIALVASTGALIGLVLAFGIAFFSIGNALGLVSAAVAAYIFVRHGPEYLLAALYVLQLVGDPFAYFGHAVPPNPASALANISPYLAMGVLAALVFLTMMNPSALRTLGRMWGWKALYMLIFLGLFQALFSLDLAGHAMAMSGVFLLIALAPLAAARSTERIERITRWLLFGSIALRLGLYVWQLATRPFQLTPRLSSLSALEVDNQFRLGGASYGANNTSLTLLVLLPFALWYLEKRRAPLWLKLAALTFLGYIVYRSDTRTTWLGFVLVVALFYGLLRRWDVLAFFAAMIVGAGLSLTYIYAKLVLNVAQHGGLTGSSNNASGRLADWSVAIRAALDDGFNWVVGRGWGMGGMPDIVFPGGSSWISLHSFWVTVLVTSGLVGLVCWIVFLAANITQTARAALAPSPDRSWFVAGLAAWAGVLVFSSTANLDWYQPMQMVTILSVNMWARWQLGAAHTPGLVPFARREWTSSL